MDLAELDIQLGEIVRSAWADSTLKTRNSQWKNFIQFCHANGLIPVPADVITVARFLVKIAANCKYTTCNNYLSAVVSLHKFFGHQGSFRDCYVIQLVLKGLGRRLGKVVDQKIGLTPVQLLQVYDHLDHSSVDTITKWTAIILSFRSLLRKSNLVQSSYKEQGMVIRRSDVEFTSQGVILHVKKTKTIQASDRVLHIPVNYVSCRKLCAATLLCTHFMRTLHETDGPLFLISSKKGGWKPLLYNDLLAFLKSSVKSIGLSPEQMGLHSLRRAGAAFLQSIGVSLVDIMNTCDWKSLAALSYMVSPIERKLVIEETVCSALSSLE